LSVRIHLTATTTITNYTLAILIVNESHPAAANVRIGAAKVVENVAILAAGILQGVGEDRQFIKPTMVIDLLGESMHDAFIPNQPNQINAWNTKGITKDLTNKFNSESLIGLIVDRVKQIVR
jgi:hypothetical protein